MMLNLPAPKLAVARDYHTILYGGPDLLEMDGEIGRPVFEEMRKKLLAEGYGGVWCDMPGTDLEEAVCILDPESIRIVGIIRIHGEDLDTLEDPVDDSQVDFDRDVAVFASVLDEIQESELGP